MRRYVIAIRNIFVLNQVNVVIFSEKLKLTFKSLFKAWYLELLLEIWGLESRTGQNKFEEINKRLLLNKVVIGLHNQKQMTV